MYRNVLWSTRVAVLLPFFFFFFFLLFLFLCVFVYWVYWFGWDWGLLFPSRKSMR